MASVQLFLEAPLELLLHEKYTVRRSSVPPFSGSLAKCNRTRLRAPLMLVTKNASAFGLDGSRVRGSGLSSNPSFESS